MKTTLKTIALCAALGPVAAFADEASTYDPTDDELNAFRAAITEVGCTVLSDDAAAEIEAMTGFGEEVLEAVVAKLRVYDEIVDASEEGGIALVSGECAV